MVGSVVKFSAVIQTLYSNNNIVFKQQYIHLIPENDPVTFVLIPAE